MYMALKYFTSIDIVISFPNFTIEKYRNDESMKFAEQFERLLIEKVLKYRIYMPTPLEIITHELNMILTEDQICRILMKYGKMNVFEGTMERLASICED